MNFPSLFEERMKLLFGQQYDEFVNGYQTPLRRGLRINVAKISVEEFASVFNGTLSPSPFATECFYLDSEHKAGSDPLHHAGAYYMQEPSASSAVSVLNPQAGERVLDLCAAPGGKSTQIAAKIGEDGLLWCNEYVTSRAKILQQNIERCGIRHAVVTNRDTGPLCEQLADRFDAVLVDAPCSGEGMFRKEPQALIEWSLDNIKLCANRQDEILNNAAKAVRPGGRMVYSTCTFAPEENEGAVFRFLSTHPEFALQKIDVNWGCAGFDAKTVSNICPEVTDVFDLTYCRRILPQHGGEGHFIALFTKSSEEYANTGNDFVPPIKDTHRQATEELYNDCFTDVPKGVFVTFGDTVRLLPSNIPECRGSTAGVAVATVCKNRLEPCHSIFVASSPNHCRRKIEFSPDSPALRAFLHGEEIPCEEKGWTAVCVAGCVVGFGKASGGKLKNRYPKGLRLL